MRSRLASLSLAALALLGPASARADTTFPGRIKTHLGLSYTPPCNICHTSPLGFPAPTTQPFALAMKAAGLWPPTHPTRSRLRSKRWRPTMQDSDCNGLPDIQQLEDGLVRSHAGRLPRRERQGRDPNPPGEYIDGTPTAAAPIRPGLLRAGGVRLRRAARPPRPAWKGRARAPPSFLLGSARSPSNASAAADPACRSADLLLVLPPFRPALGSSRRL